MDKEKQQNKTVVPHNSHSKSNTKHRIAVTTGKMVTAVAYETVNSLVDNILPTIPVSYVVKVGSSGLRDWEHGTTRNTVLTGAKIAGGWGGGYTGAIVGAWLGTMILPGIGGIVGGFIGSLGLGVTGAVIGLITSRYCYSSW